MAIFFTSWEIVLIKTIPWAFRREFLLSNRCMDHVIPNSLRAIYFVMTAFYANELFELLRSNHPMYKVFFFPLFFFLHVRPICRIIA